MTTEPTTPDDGGDRNGPDENFHDGGAGAQAHEDTETEGYHDNRAGTDGKGVSSADEEAAGKGPSDTDGWVGTG